MLGDTEDEPALRRLFEERHPAGSDPADRPDDGRSASGR